MPDYRVTAKRKNAGDIAYDRMLDMLQTEHGLAPINPGEDSRVYIITATDSGEVGARLGLLLDEMHFGNWPDHIAGFETEVA